MDPDLDLHPDEGTVPDTDPSNADSMRIRIRIRNTAITGTEL
jgi:hypothetical protein